MANAKITPQNVDDMVMPRRAIIMALCTFFLFASLDTSAKYLVTSDFNPLLVSWARYTVHFIILFVFLRAWSTPKVWRLNQPFYSLLRAALLPAMTILNFQALQYLQLDQTMTVFLVLPLVVTALAGPMLGEWAGLRRWIAIMVGFIGVIIVARPGTSMFSPPILFSIGSTLCMAVYTILTRKLANSETTESLMFMPALLGAILFFPSAATNWQMPDSPLFVFLMCAMGIFGMTGHFLFIRASKITAAAKLSPFTYSELLWMVLYGFFVFGDVPDAWTMLGAAVICSSGIYLMYRERQIRISKES